MGSFRVSYNKSHVGFEHFILEETVNVISSNPPIVAFKDDGFRNVKKIQFLKFKFLFVELKLVSFPSFYVGSLNITARKLKC